MKSSVLSFQHLGFCCTLIRSSRKTVSLSRPDTVSFADSADFYDLSAGII